ncbi:MAG TPA: ribulose-phosphate 3-epimerase [Terriglobia bacterium]|nr:ribulose-phosphate 3-epimerase [Terriglobia bacterium]
MALIAPALLAGDFARLGEALRIVEAAGGRMIHLDVADGHFAREITVGLPVLQSIRRATRLELDVHLLIERPERFVPEFVSAGADRVAVHPESTPHLHRALTLIRQSGAKAGVALEPGTPLGCVEDVLDELDFLSILTADPLFKPGFAAGPAEAGFIPAGLGKLRQALRMREARDLRFQLQAEGGVGRTNLDALVLAGADILVGDFAIFQRSDVVAQLSELIRRAAHSDDTRPGRAPSTGKGFPQGS